jgi:hypothetical protein
MKAKWESRWYPGVAPLAGVLAGIWSVHAADQEKLGAAGRILIVQLCPAGAMRILGVPMSSLVGRAEKLDLVVGAESQRLRDFVLGEDDEIRCVQAISSWLMDRLSRQPRGCNVTTAVLQEMTRTAGRIRVKIPLTRSTSHDAISVG